MRLSLERKYSPLAAKSVRRYTNHAGPVPFSKKDFYYFIAYESLCCGRLVQPVEDWLADKCASSRALLPLIKIYERRLTEKKKKRKKRHFSHPSDAQTVSLSFTIRLSSLASSIDLATRPVRVTFDIHTYIRIYICTIFV